MTNCRTYGTAPYQIALVHGGPGAAGEMAPVAKRLAATGCGIIEPLQTADSLDGQIDELAAVLCDYGEIPVILAGHSWGAWLSCLVAAAYPERIRKLILIGSGPFEDSYAKGIHETRMARLTQKERGEVQQLIQILSGVGVGDFQPDVFARFGELMSTADNFDPIPSESSTGDTFITFRPDIFQRVWPVADCLRRSGVLLERMTGITCPVVAIHGDWDPHPAAGVQKPLTSVLRDFRFILLHNCGHSPWYERQAHDKFYTVLERELAV